LHSYAVTENLEYNYSHRGDTYFVSNISLAL
jgi:hypothetical protein